MTTFCPIRLTSLSKPSTGDLVEASLLKLLSFTSKIELEEGLAQMTTKGI